MLAYLCQSALLSLFFSASVKNEAELALLCASSLALAFKHNTTQHTQYSCGCRRQRRRQHRSKLLIWFRGCLGRLQLIAGVSLVTLDAFGSLTPLVIYAHCRARLTIIYSLSPSCCKLCRLTRFWARSVSTHCNSMLQYIFHLTSSTQVLVSHPVPPAPLITNHTGRPRTKPLCKWNTYAICVI